MYRVALIQNQSEMAHYGYADARPLIAELDYETDLFTADNIDGLKGLLTRKQFDAIVLGSNALNDKTIRAELASEPFRQSFRSWLSENRGCLVLHQLRLGDLEDSSLSFLPPPLDSISAVVRPSTEKSADGEITFGQRTQDHILLLYPNQVDPAAVRQTAVGFRSLPALYWHSWRNFNLADWEVVLVDPSSTDGARSLLLSAREPRSYRVVVSALTLDWQKQRPLLQNLLTYIVEGRHNTAVLIDEASRNTAFDYLVGTLQSRKYPFKRYLLSNDAQGLLKHIKSGVHTILVLGPFNDHHQVPKLIADEIDNHVSSGTLKLITVEEKQRAIRRFSVAGRERLALPLLQDAELRIQAELREGYIDGSFWSTAETLQTLLDLSETVGDYKKFTKPLELANKHDREGSYDEVFGVTCAFLWMRATYFGVDADATKATASWIRARATKYDNREQLLAYLTLLNIGSIQKNEKDALAILLNGLTPEKLSENDVVVYLRAALAFRHLSAIPGLIATLSKSQIDGAWVDLATTATAITALIDSLDALRDGHASYGGAKPDIERMIFGGITYIQSALAESLVSGDRQNYPWDGKANTTVKCIQALLRFEKLVDLPIQELVATLDGYNRDSTKLLTTRQALSLLEELKQDNSGLKKDLAKASNEGALLGVKYDRAEQRAKRVALVAVIMPVILYLLITIIVAIFLAGGLSQFGSIMKIAFVDGFNVHLTVLAALAAYLVVPWSKLLKRLRTKHDEH